MKPVPFAQIVAEHGATVWAVCRSILSETDADDAWQETMIAAMRHLPDPAEGTNLAAWLTVIARNKSIDIHRRRVRQATPVADITAVADRVSIRTGSHPDPESTATGSGTIDGDLRAALARLTERRRTAVLAHHVAGYSYAEIGELLGSSEDAARRSAADGIAELRRRVGRRS